MAKPSSSSGRFPGLGLSASGGPDPGYEEALRSAGHARIAGVDEAGRGPLAGPVVAAAVILPFPCAVEGIRDSKLLTAARREHLFDAIAAHAVAVGVGVSDVATIDRINILQTARQAMREAVLRLASPPDYVLVDAVTVPDIPFPQRGIIHGDRLCLSIAAASIVAKVTRDRMMVALHAEFPQYGFAAHKGYATPEHLESIARHGVCPAHRRSFAPVRASIEQAALFSGGSDGKE